jgi:hypothetical protein
MSSDGLKSQNETKRFLVFLREFKAFRVLVFWLFVGLVLVAWLIPRVTPTSTVGLFFALTHTFFAGFGIILYLCYREFKTLKPDGLTETVRKDQFRSVMRELILSIPLLIGGIANIFFIIHRRFDYVLIVSVVCLPLWICLRYLLGRNKDAQ